MISGVATPRQTGLIEDWKGKTMPLQLRHVTRTGKTSICTGQELGTKRSWKERSEATRSSIVPGLEISSDAL